MKSASRRLALALFFAGIAPAAAVLPGEQLPDPAMEARARKLSGELRCLVCQNQSIDDSDAELARDLRRLVRERISAGESDSAIRSYLVTRYGEFVLLRPSFSVKTFALWAMPALALLGGGIVAMSLFRRRGSASDETESEPVNALGEDEKAALAALIERHPPR
jgi:cytochrome c-type biogenesis protein CcmH